MAASKTLLEWLIVFLYFTLDAEDLFCCYKQKRRFICDALRDLVPFLQFKKHEKHPWRSVNFSKVAGLLKLTLPLGYLLRFLSCTNDTKSRNAPHISYCSSTSSFLSSHWSGTLNWIKFLACVCDYYFTLLGRNSLNFCSCLNNCVNLYPSIW